MTFAKSVDPRENQELAHAGPQDEHSRRLLVVATGALLGTIFLAMSGLALWIRPGSLLFPLESRSAYIASAGPGWVAGWLLWMVCALSLVAFLFAVANYTESRYADLALTLGAIGTGTDIFCQALQATVLPVLAAEMPATRATFLAVEQLCLVGSVTTGPAFYTLGIPLIMKALRHRSPMTRALGSVALACGAMMVASGFTTDGLFMGAATAVQLTTYCLWAVSAVRDMLATPALQPASLHT